MPGETEIDDRVDATRGYSCAVNDDDIPMEALVRGLARPAKELEGDLERIEASLLRAAPATARMFAPMRSAAASALTFAMAAAPIGCGGNVAVDRPGGRSTTGTTTISTTTTTTTTTGGCPDPPPRPTEASIQAAVAAGAACYSGGIGVTEQPPPIASFSLDVYAGMVGLRPCDTPAGAAAASGRTVERITAAEANGRIGGRVRHE